MELSELTTATLEIFECKTPDDLPVQIKKCVDESDLEKYQAFKELVGDLEQDWLQQIFQYWLADRKEKMQDYTPKSLAKLMGVLALQKHDGKVIDMCAGSGALTIQTWAMDKSLEFECLEFDENVLPILLFNLSLRNIKATVKHMDVLQDDVMATYEVLTGEKFGKVVKR